MDMNDFNSTFDNAMIQINAQLSDEWKLYWTAKCNILDECVGGGSTPMEALKELLDNISTYLTYQETVENENSNS